VSSLGNKYALYQLMVDGRSLSTILSAVCNDIPQSVLLAVAMTS